MKSVLISIQPKWCELIASGKKTVEVRKTRPKLETPFKVYIYMTKSNLTGDKKAYKDRMAGKVIGEFMCDEIQDMRDVSKEPTCLSIDEWLKYTDGHKGIVYGWCISDLVIYDEPKELSEFHTIKKCKACKWTGYESTACIYDKDCKVPFTITRPPQSWCYVDKE